MTVAGRTNYWFHRAPLVDLAVLRIVTLACQVFFVHLPVVGLEHASWGPDLASLQSIYTLPSGLFDPILIFEILSWPFGGAFIPSIEVVKVVWWITLISGIFGLVGFLTNPSIVVFGLASLFLQALQYSFRDIHHAEAVMIIALGILALSPCGARLSADRLWKKVTAGRRLRQQVTNHARTESEFAAWPILLIQWFFVLMYLSADISKLSSSGLSWANGYTMQWYLLYQDYRVGSPLGLWLAEYRLVLMSGQWAVLVFQATFILAVLFPKMRWIYVPAGLGFHISSYILLDAYFYQWIALYVVFIPWSRVMQLARPLRKALVHRLIRKVQVCG